MGAVVNQRLTNELPLNGRNFIQLATLSPGVNGVGLFSNRHDYERYASR
jgi:hypothetical protein